MSSRNPHQNKTITLSNASPSLLFTLNEKYFLLVLETAQDLFENFNKTLGFATLDFKAPCYLKNYSYLTCGFYVGFPNFTYLNYGF